MAEKKLIPTDPTSLSYIGDRRGGAFYDEYPSLAEDEPENWVRQMALVEIAEWLERLEEPYRTVAEIVLVSGDTQAEAARKSGLSKTHTGTVVQQLLDDLDEVLAHARIELEDIYPMSKSKRQGTAFERATITDAQEAGLDAERLPEGGSLDLGDVRINLGQPFYLECKARERLSVHVELDKSIDKSGTERTALVWKRLQKANPKDKRRRAVGVGTLAVITDRALRCFLAEEQRLLELDPEFVEAVWSGDIPSAEEAA